MFGFTEKQTILVTGMPRSGTTVIGQRLTGPHVGELYEPLSVSVGDLSVRRQFELIGPAGMPPDAALKFIARLRRGLLFGKWPSPNVPRNPLFNRTRRTMTATLLNPGLRTIVWKDPFAIFWARFIAERGLMPVVITVRDPLAIVASFARMDWRVDIADLRHRLVRNGTTLVDLPASPLEVRPVCHDAVHLWRIVHEEVSAILAMDLPVSVIEIEQNLANPGAVGRQLEKATGLSVVSSAAPTQERVGPGRTANGDEMLPKKAHLSDRSTASITDYWRKILTPAEVEYCQNLNAELYARLKKQIAIARPSSDA